MATTVSDQVQKPALSMIWRRGILATLIAAAINAALYLIGSPGMGCVRPCVAT